MDRTRAAAALDGWQGAARRHFQAGRSLSSTVARDRCNIRCSTRPAASAKASLADSEEVAPAYRDDLAPGFRHDVVPWAGAAGDGIVGAEAAFVNLPIDLTFLIGCCAVGMCATRSVVQACPPGQASYPQPLRFGLGR